MAMNIFRLLGDSFHVISILLLLRLALFKKDGTGISMRSQELFLLTFLARYLDLFTTFFSFYNSLLQVFNIASTAFLLHKVQKKKEDGSCMYDQARDNFPHVKYLVAPWVPVVTVIHLLREYPSDIFPDLFETLWTFSICIESVAIIPQLTLLQKYRKIQPTLAHSILCLGLYRALYILNWVYRSYTEPHYRHHYLVYTCGVIQVVLYADFFYSYMQRFKNTNSSREDQPEEELGEVREQAQRNDNHLVYEPILQDHLRCCNHVSKEEDEATPDDTAGRDENSESQQDASITTNQEASPATADLPVMIFTRPCLFVSVPITVFFFSAVDEDTPEPEANAIVTLIFGFVTTFALAKYKGSDVGSSVGYAALVFFIQFLLIAMFGSDPIGLILIWAVLCYAAVQLVKLARRGVQQVVPMAAFDEKMMEELQRMVQTADDSCSETDLEMPLLNLQDREPVNGEYQGEHKQTSIRLSTIFHALADCSISLKFEAQEGGWAIKEGTSFGTLAVRGSDNGSSPKEVKFTITNGYVSAKSGKCYWVEKDLEGETQRVILGTLDFESNSISAEWQSSAGTQGSRVLKSANVNGKATMATNVETAVPTLVTEAD